MSDATRFVVRRLNWRWVDGYCVRLPGEVRLASFDTRDAADADRADREAEVRGRLNPFHCGTTWASLTTFPESVFADWLTDAGLTPPKARGKGAWVGWWHEGQVSWSAHQREQVWAALDRVRFFEVIERRASAVAFAVVCVMWEYNDTWYEPGAEGGRTVSAYRSRERAEAERQRLEAEARAGWGSEYRSVSVRRWELEQWPTLGPDVGTDFHEAFDELRVPLYEVVEIDLDGGEP